jgi:hypothetical protein
MNTMIGRYVSRNASGGKHNALGDDTGGHPVPSGQAIVL